jgi:hypothetical protein
VRYAFSVKDPDLPTLVGKKFFHLSLFTLVAGHDDTKVLCGAAGVIFIETLVIGQAAQNNKTQDISEDRKQDGKFETDDNKRKPSNYGFAPDNEFPLNSGVNGKAKAGKKP